ncbi:GNAT family N-acetyltransferase [Streptomyces sp. NBC_01198]|uniref:GNAT family N-acetyltransferase n=1 Tax=Streptomyces sp. NBC_01198 TaxID=2903769 RepID=UPI002E0FEF6A|nr:GNAT family N-acetyltransferase [Streptomyces sp. NBC_01198]
MTTVIDPVVPPLPAATVRRWQTAVVTPADAPALHDLVTACSQATLRLRFFGQVRAFPAEYLAGVLAGRADVHDAVVAYAYGASSARPVGLASLALPPDGGAAELGVLVADAWQRQGAGRAMVDLLLARARARGVRQVSAAVLPGRSALLAALGRHLPAEHLAHSTDGPSGVYKLDRP